MFSVIKSAASLLCKSVVLEIRRIQRVFRLYYPLKADFFNTELPTKPNCQPRRIVPGLFDGKIEMRLCGFCSVHILLRDLLNVRATQVKEVHTCGRNLAHAPLALR